MRELWELIWPLCLYLSPIAVLLTIAVNYDDMLDRQRNKRLNQTVTKVSRRKRQKG